MTTWTTLLLSASMIGAGPDDPVIAVDAARVLHRVSPYLYGACIEDVNHEIYGGLYSQMIFGESFQESSRPLPLKGFTVFGGGWRPSEGAIRADPGDGPKLIADLPAFAVGEVGVEVFFPTAQGGNAGLILKVDQPGVGADRFTGYEVSLETSGKLVLGRHRQNWEPLREVPCAVPVGRWIPLVVRLKERSFEVLVNGKSLATFEDSDHPLGPGRIGLRTWQRPAQFRNLRVESDGSARTLAVRTGASRCLRRRGERDVGRDPSRVGPRNVSRWRSDAPFAGRQSQRLTFLGGEGEIGIENRGLNRQGMNFVAGKPYEGYVWARSSEPTPVFLAMESRDGAQTLDETRVEVQGSDWTRYDFALTPRAAVESSGRFAIKLKKAGLGLGRPCVPSAGRLGAVQGAARSQGRGRGAGQPGLDGPPLRRVDGQPSRVSLEEHDRPARPSTAGRGDLVSVLDQRLGDLRLPELLRGRRRAWQSPTSTWGRPPATWPTSSSTPTARSKASGVVGGPPTAIPQPYRLKYVELGNEEAVNDAYFAKFKPIAEAMWAKDPGLILVVGDFAYNKVIVDPYHFEGGAAANSLAAHRKILELAREHGREVWFDIHVWTDHPPEPNGMKPERSYIEQLGKLAPGRSTRSSSSSTTRATTP